MSRIGPAAYIKHPLNEQPSRECEQPRLRLPPKGLEHFVHLGFTAGALQVGLAWGCIQVGWQVKDSCVLGSLGLLVTGAAVNRTF